MTVLSMGEHSTVRNGTVQGWGVAAQWSTMLTQLTICCAKYRVNTDDVFDPPAAHSCWFLSSPALCSHPHPHTPIPLGPTMAKRDSRSSPNSRLRKRVGPPERWGGRRGSGVERESLFKCGSTWVKGAGGWWWGMRVSNHWEWGGRRGSTKGHGETEEINEGKGGSVRGTRTSKG